VTGKSTIWDSSGAEQSLGKHEYFKEMTAVKLGTMLALKMHRDCDFENFGRVLALKPEIWEQLKALSDGGILEEESMHSVLNCVIKTIIRAENREDASGLRFVARDMFAHFLQYHCAPSHDTEKSSWVKNKLHDPHRTGVDAAFSHVQEDNLDDFNQYMRRAMTVEPFGTVSDTIHAYALLTAIIASGSLRYAATLKARDDETRKKFSLYVGLIFSAASAAVSAAPLGAGAASGLIGMAKDVTAYAIDRSETWTSRDISDAIMQVVIGSFYNPAVDGIRVPGFAEKRVPLARNDIRLRTERERRMEYGRHYAEISHRYLAELMPSLMLWHPPAPQSYLPE
jgi:hypothetical protein